VTDLHLAYKSARGVQATCPTTGEPYITSLPRYSEQGGRQVVSCPCRHCDAMLHTRTDREFDPSQPQWHMYVVADHDPS
jgi:hypothetical protein